VLKNVDDQKRTEHAIRESEERFRQFADYSSDVIWILGLQDRRLEYLSRAYDVIWGQSRDADLGYWTETIHPDDREQAAAGIDAASRGETIVQQYRIVRRDGAMRSVRDTLFPMRDRYGHIRRVGGLTHDLTIRASSLVYLIDGDEEARDALQLLLTHAGYSIKSFRSGPDFLAVAPVLSLGCIVLDSRSPAAGGLTVPRQLKAVGSRLPVLMIGWSNGDVRLAVQAMKAGAVDWIEMPSEPEVLVTAVASALADIRAAAEQNREVELVRGRVAAMSSREREVLEGLLAGGTNKTIGRDLGISPRTVELHRASVMEKLGVQNLTKALLLIASAGIRPILRHRAASHR
jgi:PAS domain S-box-containing protein